MKLISELRAAIEQWLLKLANDDMETFTNSWRAKNNLYYWSALAPAILWTLHHDIVLGAYALHALESLEAQLTPEGRLPLEVRRGQRALTYSSASLEALIPIWRLLERGGMNIPQGSRNALLKFASRTIADACDPTDLSLIAGTAQEPFTPQQAAWLELMPREFVPPIPTTCQIPLGPYFRDFLGGRVSGLADRIRNQ